MTKSVIELHADHSMFPDAGWYMYSVRMLVPARMFREDDEEQRAAFFQRADVAVHAAVSAVVAEELYG